MDAASLIMEIQYGNLSLSYQYRGGNTFTLVDDDDDGKEQVLPLDVGLIAVLLMMNDDEEACLVIMLRGMCVYLNDEFSDSLECATHAATLFVSLCKTMETLRDEAALSSTSRGPSAEQIEDIDPSS